MKQNVGGADRIIRGVAGVGLLGWALATGQAWWIAVIGGVLLFTAAVGWCPPYALLGFSTSKKD